MAWYNLNNTDQIAKEFCKRKRIERCRFCGQEKEISNPIANFILENNNEELKKVFVDYKDNKLIVSKGLDNQQAA